MESLPYLLALSCLLPLALIPRRLWRRLRVWTTSLSPTNAVLPRCLAGGLAALMALLPLDLNSIAQQAAAYAALDTTTWGLDGSVTTYDYDANGAVVRKTTTGPRAEVVEFEYDLAGRLVASTTTRNDGGREVIETTRHTLNAQGVRVRTETSTSIDGLPAGTTTNVFIVDTANPTGVSQVLEELPAVGAKPRVSYVLGDAPLAQTRDNGALTTHYLLPDGHRSTRQVADEAGSAIGSFGYDAFGMMLGGNPTSSNPAITKVLHAGETFDGGIGQYHLRARSYDPGTGRFTSVDPVFGDLSLPETLHRYVFGGNDPVNQLDPSGESFIINVGIAVAIFLVIGALMYVGNRPWIGIGGGDWEVFKAFLIYPSCPAWPHVLRGKEPKAAKETARLMRHFQDWYRENQFKMQHWMGGGLYFWAPWACVDHAVQFASYIRSKRNEDPNVPLLTFYRLHIMGQGEASIEYGLLGLVPIVGDFLPGEKGAKHTFLIARKRGLAASSSDDIGINFDSWWYYTFAPNQPTFYGQSGYKDWSMLVYSEYSDLF
ncbi:MAG: RHS repeat-associated core domain-containing protein [Verrucomicrobia bacterium]|nr:RHS repeat-associated core domain-containing protein [Verrucomicrobiota bacterium]